MLLRYSLEVVGFRNVDRALSGIERRLQLHNARSARILGQPTRSAAMRAPSAGRARPDGLAQSFGQIARAGMTADRRRYAEQARLESNAHRQRIAHLRAEERAAMQARRAASREFQRRTGGAVAGIRGGLGTVGRVGLAAAGIGGGALIAGQLSQATSIDREITRLAVNARQPGQAAIDTGQLKEQVRTAAIRTGLNPEQIVGGLQAAVAKTGDLSGALRDLNTISTAAMATGADVAELYTLQADAVRKFGISADDAQTAIAMLTAQGKKGQFELRDLAAQAPRAFSAAAAFGFKGMSGLKDIGGLLQVARDVTGGADTAAFAVEATLRQMVSKGGQMQSGEAFGGKKVQVFEGGDPTKGARDFAPLLRDILVASGGNAIQLQKVFGEEGIKLIRPFLTRFRNAGGGEAGADDAVSILTDAATVTADWKDIQIDAAEAMKSASAQLEILNAKLGKAIETDLLPALVKLLPYVNEAVPYFARFIEVLTRVIDFLAENPWLGLGILVGGIITKELVSAGLGAVAARAIQASFGVGSGAAGTAPAGGQGGKLAAAGMGAALGLTIASAIFTVGVANFEASEVNMKQSGAALNDIRAMTSPEQAAEARKILMGEEAKLGELKSGGPNWMDAAARSFGLPDITNDRTQIKTQESFVEEARKRVEVLEALERISQELAKAGTSQEEAAKKLNEAATKLGLPPPNRGNSPSPVKS